MKETGRKVSLFRLEENFAYNISSELRSLEDGAMIEIERKTSGGTRVITISITEEGRQSIPAN
ncbi:MAG: hypothetical protein KAQ64_03795 [Candidatus Pacebacteria bacterium]|nr:hypothetical protein [Candidatus Paceibacterota bacterium]